MANILTEKSLYEFRDSLYNQGTFPPVLLMTYDDLWALFCWRNADSTDFGTRAIVISFEFGLRRYICSVLLLDNVYGFKPILYKDKCFT